MSRTLRGFDTAFPYLGARGDVTDADVPDPGLIAKEQAYGADYDLVGNSVVSEMFGADDEDDDYGLDDEDDFGVFDTFGDDDEDDDEYGLWLHNYNITADKALGAQGAASTMVAHRYGYNRLTGEVAPGEYQRAYYGASAPPGFTIGPMGQLVKDKAPVAVPQSPQAAAHAANLALTSRRWNTAGGARKTIWELTGNSWQVVLQVPPSEQPGVDRMMKETAKKYNVGLFKLSSAKSPNIVTYVFSMAPRSVAAGGFMSGHTVKAMNRTV